MIGHDRGVGDDGRPRCHQDSGPGEFRQRAGCLAGVVGRDVFGLAADRRQESVSGVGGGGRGARGGERRRGDSCIRYDPKKDDSTVGPLRIIDGWDLGFPV